MINQEKIRWIMSRTKSGYAQAEALLHSYNYNIDLIIESRSINSV